LQDIESLENSDSRNMPTILTEYSNEKRLQELKDLLLHAEAFSIAIIGTTYDKWGRNKNTYRSWQNKIIREINKLNGISQPNFWDMMAKTRKSRKF